ncbi:MAG: valine--tRNA ligase [Bacteroidetes bacterium GWF2_41_61]|nr:MAG: valine--tRNA ligase [Bacteroidetes bacterium GWE2_40_15]OFY28018.1 MAG: valine--tRNA ligase [Bacteroidetes bacterium GWF2_41_61]HBG25377.1 valine--tRNA ligase [Rikenellaceae bacterium]
MEISAKYDPSQTESKWYKYWLDRGFFHSEPNDKEPYTIVIPPPNVTGVLHMGHMLNNTIQDVLVRRARMSGKNACWVPGTDHASIATEAKVVAKLKAEGIEKSDITREEFLSHAWEWKEKHGGIILEQLKKLGASCDWERTSFTMDPQMSKAVINTFVHYYKKGLIYRGVRMVNWDPEGQTAVSDEEVIHKDTPSKLYYIRYYISENGIASDKFVEIATTRPETIMADTAVCVHPMDERFNWLKGKKVLIPLINKEIPVIEDEYVSMDFGTGCLKITPAHDINDYEIGIRHNLPVVDILDNFARLNEKAIILVGEDRFIARKRVVMMLAESGNMVKEEPYNSQIGYSERTNAVIEPRLSLQWFLKMDQASKPALAYVMEDKIKLIPDKYRNTYRHWMENVKDWCISRQLWWGQQIPAWYLPDGKYVVASNLDDAHKEALRIDSSVTKEQLRQDSDVLDTWFSSWLWPISVFDPEKPGFPDREPNRELSYYYPTNDLVTAPEILFFWVARMVMAGHEFCGDIPFKNVYLTGTVRDKLGRKMSKSLGNSPDPIKLMEEYGADGVRLGMLLCSSAGNDILFDESQVEQGRNFSNKVWNAYRLVKGWSIDHDAFQPNQSAIAVKWFENHLSQSIEIINDHFDKFRLSDALMLLYKLFWDDFCAWYLEIIKPAFGKGVDSETHKQTIIFFDQLTRLLHPFIPFITEELWQGLSKREINESVMTAQMPTAQLYSTDFISSFNMAKSTIVNIRSIRQAKGISPKEPLTLFVKGSLHEDMNSIVCKMANITSVMDMSKKGDSVSGSSFMVETTEFFVPLEGMVNVQEELTKIDAELKHLDGFLKSVNAKLSNEKFMASAPEQVVEIELKKRSDATIKIEKLKKLREELSR